MNCCRSRALGLVFATLAIVGSASATDGLWIWPEYWGSKNWTNIDCWYQEQRAGDGGVADMPSNLATLTQDAENLTLSALRFTDLQRTLTFQGLPIKLTGDAEVRVVGTANSPIIKLETPAAESTATLRKTGSGRWSPLYSTLSGYASVTLEDGLLEATNATGTVITDSPLTVNGGRAAWSPSGSAGATGTLPSLTAGSGGFCLSVAKGSHPSLALTIGSLTLAEHSPFSFRTSGANTLGETERILIGSAEARPEIVNGLVDVRLTAQNGSGAGYPLTPLAYDEAKGFVPAVGTALTPGETTDGLATVETATQLAANTSVGALQVKGAQLTLGSGTTLTVGDNGKPAGVWIASPSVSNALAGAGTLAFGSSEGYIYRDTPKTPSKMYVETPITGTAGLNFIARNVGTANGARPTLAFAKNYTVGWSSPTRLFGYTMTLAAGTFPADHDIYVEGDMLMNQLSSRLSMSLGTYTNRLHLSGAGDGSGALVPSGGGWQSQKWTMSARGFVTLEDDAMIAPAANTLATFECPIGGTGDLTVAVNATRFSATNTYVGATKVTASYLLVDKGGTLGRGDVEVGSSANLYFLNTPTGQTRDVTNAVVTKTGTVVVQQERASFTKALGAETLTLQAGAKVETTAAVDAAYADFDFGTELKGTGAAAVLTVGRNAAETNVIASTLTGTLSLVKTGTNTVELFGPMSYTGATRVEGGTLRLARRDGTPHPSDVSYWLDAADADSLVWSEDKASYTTWKSKPGYGISFTTPSTVGSYTAHGGVLSGTNWNGRTPLFFQRDLAARAYGEKSVRQREVFMMLQGGPNANKTTGGGGPYGRAAADHSVRCGESIYLGVNSQGSNYLTWGFGYANGVKRNDYVDLVAEPLVLVFGHDKDLISGYNDYNSLSWFTPAVGGCQGNADGYGRNWDGHIGEVIGFKRTLSDGERQRVENYLAEKWLGRTLTAEADLAPIPETSLAAATTLEVGVTGVFDLNGHDVTVAALSGAGTIVNTSTNAATLRVTGSCTFAGKVSGLVSLVANGAGAVDIAFRDGAKLVVDGGSASLGAYAAGLPTDGIAFWVDASDRASMLTNASGQVTNWASRAGVSMFHNPGKVSFWGRDAVPPMLEENQLNGRPSVHFTCADTATYVGRSSMVSKDKATVKTLAFVAKRGSAGGYMIGANERSELGVIMDNDSIRANGVVILRAGETVLLNGVDKTSATSMSSMAMSATEPYVFVCTSSDWSPYASRRGPAAYYLGGYGNPGADYHLGEALAWNRVLTLEECRAVSRYLMEKWGDATSFSTNVLGAAAGVGVTGGGTLNFGGGDCTLSTLSGGNGGTLANVGTLTVSDGVTFVVQGGRVDALTINGNLTLGSQAVATFLNGETLAAPPSVQKALEVTGAVTGDFAEVRGLSRKWVWSRVGKIWSVCKQGLLLIFR